jgi:hypothetical protein
MTTDQPPFLAGDRVHLNTRTRPGDGHVLAVYPSRQLNGWEVIVRTFDTPEAPGRTVNVFTTSARYSLLTLATIDRRQRRQPVSLAGTGCQGGAR